MFRVLLLILIVMSSFAFAQTGERPQAIKIDEFEKATNGYVKMKMDAFYVELNNNPLVQGYIINYGTDREVAKREKQIRDAIYFRRFDASRVVLMNGGYRKIVKTEFWIVPAGAENPTPTQQQEIPKAVLTAEIGRTTFESIEISVYNLFIEINNDETAKGYIINYGLSRDVARREVEIRKDIRYGNFDISRIKFVRGG